MFTPAARLLEISGYSSCPPQLSRRSPALADSASDEPVDCWINLGASRTCLRGTLGVSEVHWVSKRHIRYVRGILCVKEVH